MGAGKKKRIEQNILSLEQLLKKYPGDIRALRSLGKIHADNNNPDEAEKCYRQILVSEPNSDIELFRLGSIEFKRGNFEKALDNFAEAIKNDPKDKASYSWFKETLAKIDREIAKGKIDSIIEELTYSPEVALNISAEVNKVFNYKPKLATISKEHDSFVDTMVHDLEIGADAIDRHGGYGIGFISQTKADILKGFGNVAGAIDSLETFLAKHDDIKFYANFCDNAFKLAKIYRGLGQSAKAQEAIDKAARFIAKLTEKSYDKVLSAIEDLSPDEFTESESVGKMFSSLSRISNDYFLEKTTYASSLEPIMKLLRFHGKKKQAMKIVGLINAKSAIALKEHDFDEYVFLKTFEAKYSIELGMTKRVRDIFEDVKKRSKGFTDLSGSEYGNLYIDLIRMNSSVDKEYDYLPDILKLFKSKTKIKRLGLSSLLRATSDFLIDKNEYSTLKELLSDALHEKINKFKDSSELYRSSSVLDCLEECSNYLDPEFMITSLNEIKRRIVVKDERSDKISLNKTTSSDIHSTVSGLEALGKLYAEYGHEDAAMEVIQELETEKHLSFPDSMQDDFPYYKRRKTSRSEIASEAIISVLKELKDYHECAKEFDDLIKILKSSIDFTSVRAYWVKDDSQVEYEKIDKEITTLYGKLFLNLGESGENRMDLLREFTKKKDQQRKMSESPQKVVSEKELGERNKLLEEIIKQLAKQADVHINLGNLNQAIENCLRIKGIYDSFGIMHASRGFHIEKNKETLQKVLKEVEDFEKLNEMVTNNIVIPGYSVLSKIGEGGSGKVYLAKKVIGQEIIDAPFAVKIFKLSDMHPKIKGERDRRGLKQIVIEQFEKVSYKLPWHPNIVRMFPPDDYNDSFIVPMEYMDGGTLEEQIGRLDNNQFAKAVGSIYDGLKHLHSHGYVVRDLKLNNVFVSKDLKQVKIGDLETLTDLVELKTQDRVTTGSDKYCAPELMKGEKATQESDMYAFGACIYYLLSGEKPSENGFIGSINRIQDPVEYQKKLDGRLNEITDVSKEYESEIIAITKRLLSFDPKERLCRDLSPYRYSWPAYPIAVKKSEK
jgi:tetratricopeptide (TPR) repeat protein